MPADVSFQDVSARSALTEVKTSSRLPLGVGLVVAAGASVGLWLAVAAGVKALLF